MGTYYIKDLESITGIKAHTIRIWEQRYQLVLPKRTNTNIRYYDDDDVKLLLNISLLNKKGLKISKIANLTRSEIHSEALISCKKCNENDDLINSLILATYNLNEDAFNKVFSNYVSVAGFENSILKLAFPLLQRIGDLWVSDALNPSQEHFASNIIKKKIQLAIESQTKKKSNPKKFLLVLPPGEFHVLGLLYANYLIRKKGHEALFLGANVPISDFDSVLNVFNADYIVSVFTNHGTAFDPVKFVNFIQSRWPDIKLIVSGAAILCQDESWKDQCFDKDKLLVMRNPSDLTGIL